MHIKHPFELDYINSEIDLIQFYKSIVSNNTIKFYQKFDGINISVQLLDSEFRLITKSGKKLSIFDIVNSKYPQNLKDKYIKCLQSFNMLYKNGLNGYFYSLDLDNPNKFLNCELIGPRQNVIDYNKECIIVNSIITINNNIQENNYDFKTAPLLECKVFDEHKLNPIYPTPYPIDTQKLASLCKIFDLSDDFQRDPKTHNLSIDKKLISRESFSRFVNAQFDSTEQIFINTMNMIKTNIKFGQLIKDNIQWSEQYSNKIEGIVFKESKNNELVKLTGEFYLENYQQELKFNQFYIAIAAMKPPHKGHLKLIKEIIIKCRQYNSKFYLILGNKDREDFDISKTIQILNIYLQNEGLDMSVLEILTSNEPFLEMERLILETKQQSTFNIVSGESDFARNQQFIERFKTISNHYFENCTILDEKITENIKFSSTNLRSAIKHRNYIEFLQYLPDTSKKNADQIWSILQNQENSRIEPQKFTNYNKIYIG